MFGSTNTKLWSKGLYGYIMAEYPEGSQCQITRELDSTVLKARDTGGNWAFALPEVIGLKVPKEYQEVEYIEGTGTQYISTSISASTPNLRISSTVMLTGVGSARDGEAIWAGNWTADGYLFIRYGSNPGTFRWHSGGKSVDVSAALNTWFEIETTKNSLIINGTTYQLSNPSGSDQDYTVCLWWVDNPVQAVASKARARFKATKMYSGDTLLREFIPCYRKSDNVAGLWDTVERLFYTNAGTGAFVVGPSVGDKWTAYCTDGENEAKKKVNILYNGDVKSIELNYRVPIEYQEVEYIESTGTQYIDTGVPARVHIRCEIDAQCITTNPVDQTLLGGNGTGTQNDVVVIGYNYNSNFNSYYYYVQSAFVDLRGIVDTNRHSFVINFESGNEQFIVDGIVKAQYTSTYTATTSSTTLHLFRRPNGNQSFYGRLYALRIYDYLNGGKMIREFIPCYRKSDNVAGLWDKANKVFYTNAGSGTFIVGPDL